ncbi:MAG: sodium:solute symporter [Bacteroidetes bacterium]|nr:sodium:solute symporter [Bacteroidota bacterium]
MNFQWLDWVVLLLTLILVIGYGLYKKSAGKTTEGFFLSNRQMPWWLVLLGIMGTQASAITFLTAPGQAYTDGMRFIQYYFGLPIAMIVIVLLFLPFYHRLNLFTAYEFLERRFDAKTRTLASILFLISRGLSTGISVFAPSLVLHSMLGWDIYLTNLFMGGLLIVYTVAGGARAVAYTQQLQFIIIYVAMFLAGYYAVNALPKGISFMDSVSLAANAGKMNIITSGKTDNGFDWKDRYNIWSGLIGGFFLALSYFGTDQSQVGRYLTAKNIKESRKGLLLNGLLKIPLQFFILLIGCLIFSYYLFWHAPAFFNQKLETQVLQSAYATQYNHVSAQHRQLLLQKKEIASQLQQATQSNDVEEITKHKNALLQVEDAGNEKRKELKNIIQLAVPGADTNDTNYIFLRFVSDTLPPGLVGLIIAIVFLSAWGSIAAALHSLASCTMIDLHQRYASQAIPELQSFQWSRRYTVIWGVFCILIAQFAYNMGNSLIETVNILGSWFYGTILGIFLVAFLLKKAKGNAVFAAAIITQLLIIYIYFLDVISFLWLNVIGAFGVMIFSAVIQLLFSGRAR